MHKSIGIVLAGFLAFFGSAGLALAATPSVTTVTPQSTSVGRYQKFEANLILSQTYPADSILPYYFYDPTDTPAADPGRTSPYGVDGISIDVHFTSPTGKTQVVPAFYYQDYTRTGSYTSTIGLTPSNSYFWKVRFAPSEVGTYSYYVSVATKDGQTRYPASGNLSLTSTASSAKGFIQVSKTDPRFLEHSTGESFVPVASGKQWWHCCGKRSFDIEKTYSDFAKNGINFTRLWDQNDGYGLTVEGRYDAYGYPDDYNPSDRIANLAGLPKGTQMNQRGNFEEDKIIESAQQNGVYIQLTSHGDAYWIWDGAVYDESWNTTRQAFDSARHINYWKRNFRYRVARWGYSTAIFGWETWNEHGHIVPNTAAYNFYQKLSEYQLQTDPYRHLRTTSQGSQAVSPAFWSSGFFDVANYHNYMMGWFADDLKNDGANFVYRTAWCLREIGKPTAGSTYCSDLGLGDSTAWSSTRGVMPWVWGEIDVGTNNWDEVNQITKNGEGRLRMLHNITWGGLFSPIGTSPIDWYWTEEDAQTTTAKYTQKKAATEFFNDVQYDKMKFTYIMGSNDKPPGYTGETVTVSNPTLRVYAMKSENKQFAYAWIQNRNHTWSTSASSTAPISGTISFPNLNNSSYTAEIWDTYNGTISSTVVLQPVNGVATLPVSNLSTDFAVKLKAVGATPPPTAAPTIAPIPTATPVPTATPRPTATPTPTAAPTPTSFPLVGDGDVNGDKVVNLGDAIALLTNWTKPAVVSTDQYKDGVVNSFDYAVVVAALGGAPNPTPTVQPTATPRPTATPTPVPSTTPVPTATPIPTATPRPTATPVPTATPAPIPGQTSGSWSQFGGNVGRTSNTTQTVATPWQFAWSWNGAGADGKPQSSHLSVPDLVQPVVGGGRVYMVANNTVFALQGNSSDKTNGTVLWSRPNLGTIESSVAYGNEAVYVSTTTGLYKLNAATGATETSFTSGLSFKLAPLITSNMVVVPASNGHLYALDRTSLGQIWNYAPSTSTSGATVASYSPKKNTFVYVTSDLKVHAVDGATGALKWVRKPTVRNQGDPGTSNKTLAQAEGGWPVIAEEHGLVFIRYRIDWQTLWDGPYTNGTFPPTNAAARDFLASNPTQQSLYTLKLDDGSDAFAKPANVGNGGAGDGGFLPMGPQPVVRVVDGQEVAYVIFRSQQSCARDGWCDGREDATMGEMVLDNTTVSGLTAGDMRFVQWSSDENLRTASSDRYYHDMQTDEMLYVTGSGNMLFHNHWVVSEAYTITDRSANLGGSYTQPIKATHAPNIIWRQVYCPPNDTQCNPAIYPGGSGTNYGPANCPFNANTRYCSDGLYAYGDSRSYPAGFYEYHNSYNSNAGSNAFVVVSDGLVLTKTNDGAIIAMRSGNPVAEVQSKEPTMVLGAQTVSSAPEISPEEVKEYVGQQVVVAGTIKSVTSHMPKAFYIGMTDDPENSFLVRVFAQDVSKFDFDLNTLQGKTVKISGTPSLYWPEGRIPELIITDPAQLTIIDSTPQGRFMNWISQWFNR